MSWHSSQHVQMSGITLMTASAHRHECKSVPKPAALESQVAGCGGPPVAAARLVRGSAQGAGSGLGNSEARLLMERCSDGCPDLCWWWSG